ncbi:MAG: hypothetical protein L0Z50_40235 [Verrucomicrobiales bacterium]|nr:hypothetical protein [Verrucomicrobiales bacterium]
MREVGEILGISEDAARKRVAKALERLTEFFRQRGFAVSGVTTTIPLFAAATHAAPVGLVTAVAMEWANAIRHENSRRKAFYEVFMDWKGREPSAANDFLAKCGWSAERLQELRQEIGR